MPCFCVPVFVEESGVVEPIECESAEEPPAVEQLTPESTRVRCVPDVFGLFSQFFDM